MRASASEIGGGSCIIKLRVRTDDATPFASAQIDLEWAREIKVTYPRYVVK